MRFVQVGLGYRSQAFKRVLSGLEDFECVGIVLRHAKRASVPVFSTLEQSLDQTRPDFVLSFTPAPITPAVIRQAVDCHVPVLAETPPARSRAELDGLADLASTGLVQIAEQYPLMPGHAARLRAAGSGTIGQVSQVQVSSTQTYHAMALIRAYLQADTISDEQPDRFGNQPRRATVRAARFSAPLVNPLTRAGWSEDVEPHPAASILATIDFGEGRSGVYDFTDNQTRNLLRTRRLLVRGSHGEISGEQVVRLSEPGIITTTYLNRRQTGHDLDLNGYCTYQITLGDEVLWVNPWPETRWNDDELGVAELLTRMAAWLRGEGPAPYPLAEALWDTALGLAIDEAVEQDRAIEVQEPGTTWDTVEP